MTLRPHVRGDDDKQSASDNKQSASNNSSAASLVVEWCASLADARRLSPHTVRAYAATLHRLVAFAAAHIGGPVDTAGLSNLVLTDFRAFLASRRAEGVGNASIAREIAAIRAFYAFAAGHGIMGDGLSGLASPKRAVRVPRPVAPDDARALVTDIGDAATTPKQFDGQTSP